ncbi:MAG TPA: hypothetical protein VJJ82_03645, partial [Candidatus Nanoarchaeia archaeon]|nr:hypothetical protein [Candidatus Nanoarchaeia archaeon]
LQTDYAVRVDLEGTVKKEIVSVDIGMAAKFSFRPPISAPTLGDKKDQRRKIIWYDRESRFVYVDLVCPAGQKVYDGVLACEVVRTIDSALLKPDQWTPVLEKSPYEKLNQAIGVHWTHKNGAVITIEYGLVGEPKKDRICDTKYQKVDEIKPVSRFKSILVQGVVAFKNPLDTEHVDESKELFDSLIRERSEKTGSDHLNISCEGYNFIVAYPVQEAIDAAVEFRGRVQRFISSNRTELETACCAIYNGKRVEIALDKKTTKRFPEVPGVLLKNPESYLRS